MQRIGNYRPTAIGRHHDSRALSSISLAHSHLGRELMDMHVRAVPWELKGCCETCEAVRIARRRLSRIMRSGWADLPDLLDEARLMLNQARIPHHGRCHDVQMIHLALSEIEKAAADYKRAGQHGCTGIIVMD